MKIFENDTIIWLYVFLKLRNKPKSITLGPHVRCLEEFRKKFCVMLSFIPLPLQTSSKIISTPSKQINPKFHAVI